MHLPKQAAQLCEFANKTHIIQVNWQGRFSAGVLITEGGEIHQLLDFYFILAMLYSVFTYV